MLTKKFYAIVISINWNFIWYNTFRSIYMLLILFMWSLRKHVKSQSKKGKEKRKKERLSECGKKFKLDYKVMS